MDFPPETVLESSCTKALPPASQDSPILLTLMEIVRYRGHHSSSPLVPAKQRSHNPDDVLVRLDCASRTSDVSRHSRGLAVSPYV